MVLFLYRNFGSVRPLCCDQPETVTHEHYFRIDSLAINAAPRRRV